LRRFTLGNAAHVGEFEVAERIRAAVDVDIAFLVMAVAVPLAVFDEDGIDDDARRGAAAGADRAVGDDSFSGIEERD
jgi:hypothetical protein